MRKTMGILAVLLISVSPAIAVTIKGVGAGSCSDWMDKREQTDLKLKFGVESWVLGYMSAVAEDDHRNVLSGTDAETIFKAVDVMCRLNPGQATADSARRVMDYLSKHTSDIHR
jgi:hypothetical protein